MEEFWPLKEELYRNNSVGLLSWRKRVTLEWIDRQNGLANISHAMIAKPP